MKLELNNCQGCAPSELGVPGEMNSYIPESLRSLELMQNNNVMEMGSSRFFID
jgi:hypothetical protein